VAFIACWGLGWTNIKKDKKKKKDVEDNPVQSEQEKGTLPQKEKGQERGTLQDATVPVPLTK
jgi:hypothetical protein